MAARRTGRSDTIYDKQALLEALRACRDEAIKPIAVQEVRADGDAYERE